MRTALTTILLAGMLVGCDDDDDFDNLAALRVVHASPGAPPIDVFVDVSVGPIITGLSYGQASPYVPLAAGDYDLIVRAAGSETIVFDAEIDVGDDPITAVATGYVGSTDAANDFRVLTFVEDFDDADNDEANLRIVHASPDAPTVDVDVIGDDTIDVTGLDRFSDTGEDGVAVPANEPLQIGIAANGQQVTAFTAPPLPGGSELFVIAIGNVTDLPRSSTGFSLLVVAPDGVVTTLLQNPTLYALHASPDAPAVDIRAGATGPVVVGDLAFGELAAVQVAPGDYTLSFFPAGDPGNTPIAGSNVVALNPGERYLAVATGMVTPVGNEQRLQVGFYLEQFDITDGPLLRAIHAVPDAPIVDISTATGKTLNTPPVFSELQFLEASPIEGASIGVSPGLRIGVAPARSTNAVAAFDIDTTGVQRAFGILAGALTPTAGEQSLQLFVVDTGASPWQLTTVLPAP